MNFRINIAAATALLSISGCATVEAPAERTVVPSITSASQAQAAKPEAPTLKRKVAIARFSNSTNYGKGLLFDGENDPLADQAKDMLVKRLIESDRFLVFERDNLDELAFEQSLNGQSGGFDLVGVDAVVVGSVTEFGRSTEGRSGFLSSTKKQSASATVEARLVDPKTGLAFFSASGLGEASVEAGEVAGFGSSAGYDSTLNDNAISAAVSDLTSEIVGNLADRVWRTDVLQTDGATVYISGGPTQGIQIGDRFSIETIGETISSAQTGLPITLPGKAVAVIEVESFFGDTEYSEGAVANIVEGSIGETSVSELIVREMK